MIFIPSQYVLTCFLYGILLLYIIALICAKWHSPFWFHQPIQHTYELYPRWFARIPYMKKRAIPRLGIFCRPDIIKSFGVHASSASTILSQCFPKCLVLLQGHYLDNQTHVYDITYTTLVNKILKDAFSVCTLYMGTIRMAPTYISILDYQQIYGMMTSRPVWVYFRKFAAQNMEIHVWDHICIHEHMSQSSKQKPMVRELIQTHIFNHSRMLGQGFGEKTTPVYLFKKEVDLCKGVVPLIQTNVYTFLLKKTPIQKLPIQYRLRILNKHHTDLWRGIYAAMSQYFDICIIPNMVATMEWLSNERYYVYATLYKDPEGTEHIHGVYIFEHTYTTWIQDELETTPYMLRLAGSMCFPNSPMNDPDHLFFFRGFLHSLRQVLYDQKHFGILEIPRMSHNGWILEKWQEKYEMKNETNMAYYLYNMIYPRSPISPDLCMILG